VVGATDLEALRTVRKSCPGIWILCPGVGAQGGEPGPVCAAGLRTGDNSGLLISVSRAISRANNMRESARQLVEEINELRNNNNHNNNNSLSLLREDQKRFIECALSHEALQFGKFVLKSGRESPFFFNAGKLSSGEALTTMARCYAQTIRTAQLQFTQTILDTQTNPNTQNPLEFDVVFGPAYKGIPFAAVFCMAWYELYGESKEYCYNRKEVKDHGEGGVLVGASIGLRRVLIIDDVITAGTAIRESVELLRKEEAIIVAGLVSFDRQERSNNNHNVSGSIAATNNNKPMSAIQQVIVEYGFPIYAIVTLTDVIQYIDQYLSDVTHPLKAHLLAIQEYRSIYGV
jgi:orotate phosphoribosyltransferase